MTLQYFWPYCSFKNIEPESNRKRIEKENEEENLIESKGRHPEKKRLFFYKSYKGGGGSFPFIKIYVADFV